MNMSAENGGAVISVGEAGIVETRSYDRVYLTQEDITSDYPSFLRAWEDVLHQNGVDKDTILENPRRFVLRSVISQEVLRNLFLNPLPGNPNIEALLPMDQVDGEETNYLVIVAQNQHDDEISPEESARLRALGNISQQRVEQPTRTLTETIQTLPEGYTLTTSITPADFPDLLNLWHENFEWGMSGIEAFANQVANGTQWFCGVRDQNGRLVAASMAEGMVFASRRYIELTEWAANTRGVASKMVIGLIAQVLDAVYYGSLTAQQRVNNMSILPAEMNLYHREAGNFGSPGAGSSAGLRVPNVNNNRSHSIQYNALRHNVLVGSGRLDHPEAQQGTAPPENYNNFAYGILPYAILETMYNERAVQELLEYMQLHDRANT
jgi:hypothetical protein